MRPFAARLAAALALALALATPPARAADDFERIALRVSAPGPERAVIIDRGTREAVAVGDLVLFYPASGGTWRGTVIQVDERSAVVEMQDARRVPAPGTRGEALVPAARRAAIAKPEPRDELPDHPPWENQDESFARGMPLLAGTKPVHPRDRVRSITGRVYTFAELVDHYASASAESFFRAGADVRVENPFRRGGTLHLDAEFADLTLWNDDTVADLTVRRLSYGWGGTRFSPRRWEFGRFLQRGMPEFGDLDGVEWGVRLSSGHRAGASIGWMPEPNEDYGTFDDFQIAGYYEYVSDELERLTAAAGFQKSWHNGRPDRDLFVGRLRYLPGNGWDVHGTVWIDYYTDGDTIKGNGFELTHALLSIGRRWKSGNGFDVTYRHFQYPELLRNEFLPLLAADLANDRLDRVSVQGWRWWRRQRLHAQATAWTDEVGSGSSVEAGLDMRSRVAARSRLDLTGFYSQARFVDVVGGRVLFGRFSDRGGWDAMYEVSMNDLAGFQDGATNLLQQRIRVSVNRRVRDRWDLSGYGEVQLIEDERNWTIGISVQRRF